MGLFRPKSYRYVKRDASIENKSLDGKPQDDSTVAETEHKQSFAPKEADGASCRRGHVRSGVCSEHRANNDNPVRNQNVQRRDIKVIKIFFCITLLFLVSFIPVLIRFLSLIDSFYIVYAYFINHFGNPIIYMYLDLSFRKKVTGVIKKILCV